MAAVSAAASETTVMGNKRVHFATFVTIADGETYIVPGMSRIDVAFVTLNNTAPNVGNDTEVRWSGATLTFEVAGTSNASSLLVIGN